MYLGKRARPDILLAVAYLCTRVDAPTEQDEKKLWRVLMYLNGTREQKLILHPKDNLEVQGYIDASFGCHENGKSHSGLIVTVGGASVLCKSSKQKMVTKDSTEAELVALSDMIMEVIKVNDFMKSQGYAKGTADLARQFFDIESGD